MSENWEKREIDGERKRERTREQKKRGMALKKTKTSERKKEGKRGSNSLLTFFVSLTTLFGLVAGQ